MRHWERGLLGLPLLVLAACSTPPAGDRDGQEMQPDYQRERLQRLSEYEDCVADATPETVELCDRILRAIEAVE